MKHATHKHVSTANKQLDKWTNSALNARTRTTRLTRFSKIVSTFTTFSGRCTIWAQSAGTQVSSRHWNDRNNLITLCWSVFTNFQIYLKRRNSGQKNSLKWHPNHRPRFQFGADLETESFVIGCFLDTNENEELASFELGYKIPQVRCWWEYLVGFKERDVTFKDMNEPFMFESDFIVKSLEQWNRFAMLRIGLPLVCRAVLLRSKIISWSPWQRANWPLDAAVVGLDQCDRVCANAKTDQGKLLWRTLRTWPLKNVYLTIFRISYYKTSLIWRLGIDSWIDYT